MSKVKIATLAAVSLLGLASQTYAIGITQTLVSATLLPTETVSALLSGVNKEVRAEAKKHAIASIQYGKKSSFLDSVVAELRENNAAELQSLTDDQIISALAEIEE